MPQRTKSDVKSRDADSYSRGSAKWAVLKTPCPTCGAKAGEPCHTPDGRVQFAHARRAKR